MYLRARPFSALSIPLLVLLTSCGAAYGGFSSPTALPPSPTPEPTATATATPPAPTATPEPTQTPFPSPAPTETLIPPPTPTPLPTPDGIVRTANVPILMYHYISIPPAGADAVRRDLSVSPQVFAEQLQYLKDNGYQSISLDDLNRHLQLGDPLPEKPIILTFDDGYRDNYEFAFPLLVKYGFTGAFFLVTEPIDKGDDAYLTWPQVALMSRMGMDMEPHSYTHPDLSGQPLDYVVWQVIGSKEAIEERTGKTCRFFAYPSGQYDQQVVDVLRSAYFWGALASRAGTEHSSDGMFDLARVRVRGSDTLEQFTHKLNWNYGDVL
jgi:peptidoglycan/xylan/chitin deacetylase (PgdA/CDA1 family)